MKLDDEQQKKLTIGVGIAAGLAILYFALLNPLYFGPRAQLLKDIDTQKKTAAEDARLKVNAATANVKWRALNIPMDEEVMAAELRQTVISATSRAAGSFDLTKWAENNAVNLTVPRTTERSDTRTDFIELRFTASANTTTSHIGRFLNYLESVKMPAKIEKIRLVSRKSGSDDINIEVSLSALVYAPRAGTSGELLPDQNSPDAGAGDVGFRPGAGGIIKPLDPPLPDGPDLATQLKLRRTMQLQSIEITPATAPK